MMVSSPLTDPQSALNSSDPRAVLRLARQAPAFLQSQPSQQPQFPLSLISKPESLELWINYEQLFFACLRTGDDKSADECLGRLTKRFGPENERIMGLRGIYEEALADNNAELSKILAGYDSVLAENPVNVVSIRGIHVMV